MPLYPIDSSWLYHFQLLRKSIQKMILNEYKTANKFLQQALFVEPNNADCYYLYSLSLYWASDEQKSLIMQKKAIQMNPLCEIYQLPDRDGCLRIRNIIDQAIQYEQRIQKQISIEVPVNLWYQYSILFHEQTNYQMVEIIYQRLFNKFPEVYKIKTHAFLGNYSNMLYDLGKYQEAIAKYEFQIDHDKNQMRFYSNCSLLYTVIGNYEKAEEYIKIALNKMPNRSNFLFNYANVLSKVSRFEQSLNKLNQALKNDPKDPIFNLKYAINILLFNPKIAQMTVFQQSLKISFQILGKCIQENSPDNANLNKRILSMKNIVCIKLFTEMIMELPFVKKNGKNWSQQERVLSYISDYLIVGQASKLQLNRKILAILHETDQGQSEKNWQENNQIKAGQIRVGQYKKKWFCKLKQVCQRVHIIRLNDWSQSSYKDSHE